MQNIKRVLGLIILVSVAAGAFFVFFKKKKEDREITYSTSDAKNLKGEFSIALDSWIGYFPLRSPVFAKLMRDQGYRIKIIDDKADYPGRMKMLKRGEINFAVCTVDSYILNGAEVNFPGTIVSIIDESKGGDAIVSWKDRVANIDQLKQMKNFKIAFTPSSPSEHLLKSISAHFGIPLLRDKKGAWRVEVSGAEEAYGKLIKREVDLAVVWEPHVTEALGNKGITKIIGSEDVDKLIVDILLVNRKYAISNPALVRLFLKTYFETFNIYKASPGQLTRDILSKINLTGKQVDYMLKGVKWLDYPENLRWFGLTSQSTYKQPEVIESINSAVNILTDNKDFSSNPLTDNDPYTILNSHFLRELYTPGTFDYSAISKAGTDSLARKFSKLTGKRWNRLDKIGALKLRPISFRSGTSDLDSNGRDQIKLIINNIRHYPNFRIFIKGHTGLRGDPAANRALSLKRAKSVQTELVNSYNVHGNRIRVTGIGSREPLLRMRGESERGYNTRLKRVEMLFLSDQKSSVK